MSPIRWQHVSIFIKNINLFFLKKKKKEGKKKLAGKEWPRATPCGLWGWPSHPLATFLLFLFFFFFEF
jgi:hypothetical protein